MLQIFLYPILTIFILFFLGYGLTNLLIPSRLKTYSFWLSPWFAIIFLIFSFVILSFLGLSMRSFSMIAIPFLTMLNILVFFKKDKHCMNVSLRDLIIFLFVIINIIFNLSPLIRRDRLMTAISLGNNDVIAYTVVPDYLINHSLLENFATPANPANVQHFSSSDLIQGLYRWGEGIITAFLLNIFNLKAYQFVYILQAILFALSVPLLYLIFRLIYKQSFNGMLMTLIIMGFNVNLLYILYHDFFGQVLFWGLQLFILFFIFAYFDSDNDKINKYNKYDLIIGVSLAVSFFSYYEGASIIIVPLILYFIIKLILRRNIFFYWTSLLKIFLTAFLISSYSIFTALIQSYSWSLGGNQNQPIGWQLFRQKIPFANPFEIMGLYSIHSFEPLPNIIAVILSILVIFFIIKGILKSRQKLLIMCFVTTYIILFIYTGILDHNFFTYNRAVTYSLFLFLILFIIGVIEFSNSNNKLKIIIFLFIAGLIAFSAVKLNKRFITERLSADKSLVSIKEISSLKIKEPIYMERYFDSNIPYWKEIWQHYFLYFIDPNFKVKPNIAIASKLDIPDNSLVLISKPVPWFRPAEVLLKNVLWENEYYKLGRLCNSDECLMGRSEDLSSIEIGKSKYEDSLLINGWSTKEELYRWAVSKESTLRLVTKDNNLSNLYIEASTLKEPQELSVYIDNQFVGKKNIKTEYHEYRYNLEKPLSIGVHNVIFKYSNIYRPIDYGLSQDSRELSANFRKIKLE